MNRNRLVHIVSALLICIGVAFLSTPGAGIANADPVANSDFETGDLTGWVINPQSGSLSGGVISGSGTGVTVFSGSVTFNAGSNGSVGSPTLADGSPNPYYQPAVDPAVWSFSPYGNYAVALQPDGSQQFSDATSALAVSSSDISALQSELSGQAAASGYGSGTPTDASWITKEVTLQSGITYTMSWNYIGTDYVPFNDGSITSLTPLSVTGTPTISVNNSGAQYALLGFTNPGTGDYSTGTFGSTGWQVSTYEVSITGDYLLGFAVFNLDDTALSPVLLIDSQPGSTQKNGQDFGAVAPNNPDAPTVPPTATEPPATDPPATDPPATDPPVTDPPSTDAPVDTDPPTTEAPVTDPPVEESTTTTRPRPRPRPTTTTTTVAPSTTTTSIFVPVITEPSTSTTGVAPSNGGELPRTGKPTGGTAGVGVVLIICGFGVLSLSKIRKRGL